MSAIERLLLELETGSDDDRSVAHACRVELASERADHKQFVADVLHLRGEIEYLDEECKAMREALKLCLRAMTVATEDGGEAWEDAVTKAKAALVLPRVVRSGDAARVRELEAENARLRTAVEDTCAQLGFVAAQVQGWNIALANETADCARLNRKALARG